MTKFYRCFGIFYNEKKFSILKNSILRKHYSEIFILIIFIFYYSISLIFSDPILIDAHNDYLRFIQTSISSFKNNDFFHFLLNYPSAFGPLYIIFLSYLSELLSTKYILLINILITLLNIFLLWFTFMNILGKKSAFYLIIAILLSPFLKASTLELNSDHFALFFITLSIFFFYLKSDKKKLTIYIVSLFSASFAVYTRQNLLGFYFALMLCFIYKNGFKSIILYLIIGLLIISPLFALFIFWGGLINPLMKQIHIPVSYNSTIFTFNTLTITPYLLIFILSIIYRKNILIFLGDLLKVKWKLFPLLLIVLFSILLSLNFNMNRVLEAGGGILSKFIKFIDNTTIKYFLLFFFNLIFFISIWILISNTRNKMFIIILVLSIAPFYFNTASFTKYFDPFIFIILFSFYFLFNKENSLKPHNLMLLIVYEIFMNVALFISNY